MKNFLTTVCAQVEVQLMTTEDLARIPDGQVFRAMYLQGNFFDGHIGTYLFIAKKGNANDWAVYGLPILDSEEMIQSQYKLPVLYKDSEFVGQIHFTRLNGIKITDKDYIMRVVPCTEDLFGRYRR